jgi:hypothetical protein
MAFVCFFVCCLMCGSKQIKSSNSHGTTMVCQLRERLPAMVADDKAGVQFLDSPWRRETAGGHAAFV